jgi:segregation and condensation protein B
MVRRLWPERVQRLSKAALEALSIVAYRQPCTRIEVEEVRGVDCGGVLRSLLERKLIRIVGRKDEPGRPMLYSTTTTFLETFSLADLRALPTLRDLEAMQREEAARATAHAVNTPDPPS